MSTPAPKRIPRTAKKKEAPAAKVSREELDDQVAAFLKSGGKIQEIPKGESGQQDNSPSRRHIVISKR